MLSTKRGPNDLLKANDKYEKLRKNEKRSSKPSRIRVGIDFASIQQQRRKSRNTDCVDQEGFRCLQQVALLKKKNRKSGPR